MISAQECFIVDISSIEGVGYATVEKLASSPQILFLEGFAAVRDQILDLPSLHLSSRLLPQLLALGAASVAAGFATLFLFNVQQIVEFAEV
jgi:hypothetical protein